MSCLGECLDLGPPPDTILFLPPPPAPMFLQRTGQLPDFLLLNTTPCSTAQICASLMLPAYRPAQIGGNEYMELPRKDIEAWADIGDTWLLALVASSIGVLLFGALLAMFLLKCREMSMFGGTDCSMHRPIKIHEPGDCSTVTTLNGNKLIPPSETVLYEGTAQTLHDNRMVWAALTPRGTQHFISESYPPDLLDYGEPEDHYESIDNEQSSTATTTTLKMSRDKSSFDNSGFVDYDDYEEPAPLIESYQLDSIDYQTVDYDNSDMRCTNSLRKSLPLNRPRVSSPTRIENPNLPPLNLYPHSKSNTLKKNVINGGYRGVDGALPKYGM